MAHRSKTKVDSFCFGRMLQLYQAGAYNLVREELKKRQSPIQMLKRIRELVRAAERGAAFVAGEFEPSPAKKQT